MIILDTDVIAETQKASPDRNVMAFLDSLDPTSTYITAVTVAEVLYTINVLPDESRKKALKASAYTLFQDIFKHRVLSFNENVGSRYATDVANALGNGTAVSFADGIIAGIALENSGATIATRRTSLFEAMLVPAIDPWIPIEK